MYGEGVAKDPVEAVKWYRKAAEQGIAEAQNNLGVCFMNGEGVAKDPVEAVKWYRKAAEQGHANAQNNLGECFMNGQGVAKDLEEAAKWFQKATDQGYTNAKRRLDEVIRQIPEWRVKNSALTEQFRATLSVSSRSRLIDFTHGVPITPTPTPLTTTTTTQEKKEEETQTHAALDGMDAKDWAGVRDRLVAVLAVDGLFVPALLLIRALRLARPSVFKQGDITDDEATRRIRGTSTEAKERGKRFVESLASTSPSQSSSTSGSRMFLAGHWNYWIEMDHVKAVKWYHKAAEQGNTIAQFRLGVCFMNGQGVAKDLEEAAKWFQKAADQGNTDAK
jgi:TPR repeat protein